MDRCPVLTLRSWTPDRPELGDVGEELLQKFALLFVLLLTVEDCRSRREAFWALLDLMNAGWASITGKLIPGNVGISADWLNGICDIS